MINDFDLTPDDIKQHYPEDVIKELKTFKTHGVSEKDALNYLKTEEGKIYFRHAIDADAGRSSEKQLTTRVLGQLTSGAELPRMELINEPLLKIVPKGGRSPDYSPYWTTESEFNTAIAEGKNLSKHFGLPIGSESVEYDIYRITPKQSTEVFISHVAPTTELDGQIIKQGGATQYLTPNRQLFEPAEHIGQVQNRRYIPHQANLQIPSDLKNPAIQTIGGIPRTELATMSETLTQKHGYSQAQSHEAVNARVTLNSAIEDLKAGKPLNTSEEILRSHAITRQTANVLGDVAHDMNRQVTVYNLATNGASPETVQGVLNAKPQISQTNHPFNEAHKHVNDPEPPRISRPIEHHPPPMGSSTHASWTQDHAKWQAEQLHEINKPVIAAEAQTRASQKALHTEINTSKSMVHTAGKVMGAVGVAVEVGLNVSEVKAAINQASSNREQYIKGSEAAANATARSVVTGGAATLGGIAGGIGGAATPVPGGTVIGSIGVGGAAAAGADYLYRDSIAEEAVKAYGRTKGAVAYDHFSAEGKALNKVGDLQEQISHTTDPTKLRDLQDQLARTSNTFSRELDKNTRQISAEHTLEQERAQINKENPKVWNVSLNSALNQAVRDGYGGQEAVDHALSNATAKDTNVSATHSDYLRKLATEANFKEKQAPVQSVTDTITRGNQANADAENKAWTARQKEVQSVTNALSNGREMNYARQQRQERIVFAKQWREVQSVTDVMTAARNGELGHKHKMQYVQVKHVEHHKVQTRGLHEGAHGHNVKQVQTALKMLGADIKVNGHFDKSTTHALKGFQREHHLKVNGEVDRKTAKTLVANIQEQEKRHNQDLPAQAQAAKHETQSPAMPAAVTQTAAHTSVAPQETQSHVAATKAHESQQPAPQPIPSPEQAMQTASSAPTVAQPEPQVAQTVAQPVAPEPVVQTVAQTVAPAVQTEQTVRQAAAPVHEAPEAPSLSPTDQVNVDRIVGLMGKRPEFEAYDQEQQSAMAMGLVAHAAKFNAADKVLDVQLLPNHKGEELSALFNGAPHVVNINSQEALQTTVQDVQQAYGHAPQKQQTMQQMLDREPSDIAQASDPIVYKGEAQPTIAFSRNHQTEHDRIVELMGNKSEFQTFSHEQQSAMAMSLMADSMKSGGPEKIIDVAMPDAFDGQKLCALRDSHPQMLVVPTQEALQATPQDVVMAQQNQQMVAQEMTLARQQSQGQSLTQ